MQEFKIERELVEGVGVHERDDLGLGFTLDYVITCGMRRKRGDKLIW